MTDPQKRAENALHAWTVLSDMMREHGAARALAEAIISVPDATADAFRWLAVQPLERRKALCAEFFGPAAEDGPADT